MGYRDVGARGQGAADDPLAMTLNIIQRPVDACMDHVRLGA